MKKLVTLFSALVLSFSAAVAQANGKVVVVDFQKAILTTDIAKARIAQLESEPSYKENLTKAQALSQEAQELFTQFQKEEMLLSAEKKAEMQGRLKDIQSDLQHLEGKLQEQNKQALAPILYQMQPAASEVVEQLRKDEGYGLILAKNPQVVLYADTSYEITAKVTDKLNKLAAAAKK